MEHSIYELRIRAGLTQARVARRAGISGASLSGYESGDRIPTPKQITEIKAAIAELATKPFGDPPPQLTEYERKVWEELGQLCPELPRVPSRAQCVRLVQLVARMRTEGIGNRDGKRGLTVPEIERLLYLFDTFHMTPASRGAVPWPEPASVTDVRKKLSK